MKLSGNPGFNSKHIIHLSAWNTSLNIRLSLAQLQLSWEKFALGPLSFVQVTSDTTDDANYVVSEFNLQGGTKKEWWSDPKTVHIPST
jgi:hypothetical protein